VQFGIYVSPVGFSSAIVPARWHFWYGLNPVVAPIDGFRWCLLGAGSPLDPVQVLASVIVNGLLLWLGIAYFRATERSFADII
ncbi:MAG: ABC transporter permease, partial [Rhizomicrobium sp.]